MVPDSYDSLPEGMVAECFKRITDKEIKAPVSRNILLCQYDCAEMLSECSLRLSKSLAKEAKPMSAEDLLSTTYLQNPQLFDFNNRVNGFLEKPILAAGLKFLTQQLSVRSLQICRLQPQNIFNVSKSIDLSPVLIQLNRSYQNNDWVDRLTWRMHKLIKL
jgi:hypothetical protein